MIALLNSSLRQQKPEQVSGRNDHLCWQWISEGIMQFEPVNFRDTTESIVLSAGIHGNETAPVELLDRIVDELQSGSQLLSKRLLIILGNINAMQENKRYIHFDMNRLFCQKYQEIESCIEAIRAQEIEHAMTVFYQSKPCHKRTHFDLHTAIRQSHHLRFGLLPYRNNGRYDHGYLQWLKALYLDAIVVNHAPSSTLSYFSSDQLQASSCTLELGQAKPFGENNGKDFYVIECAIRSCLNQALPSLTVTNFPKTYKVSQELTKLSDAFVLNIADDVKNFTAFEPGFRLASDVDTHYYVGKQAEYILFPNPKVSPGLRAGLMLVESSLL